MKIKSKSDLFPGMEIEKPPMATFVLGPDGERIFKCPHCGELSTYDNLDVLGAEPDCFFCNQCHGEFET